MARYAVIADLPKRLTPLRITGLTAGDAVVQEEALERACNEADLYLNGGNTPPFAELTAIGQATVLDIVLDLAVYWLATRLGSLDDRIVQLYDTAIFRLKDIRAGKASLGAMGAPAVAAPAVSLSSATRVYSRDTMGGW